MPPVTKKVASKIKPESNGAIAVESGVEIPPRTRKGTSHYPFATMEVEDSFFVAAESDEDAVKVKGRLSSACAAAKKKLEGYKFSVRGVEGGVRVWRTE